MKRITEREETLKHYRKRLKELCLNVFLLACALLFLVCYIMQEPFYAILGFSLPVMIYYMYWIMMLNWLDIRYSAIWTEIVQNIVLEEGEKIDDYKKEFEELEEYRKKMPKELKRYQKIQCELSIRIQEFIN